MTSMHVTNVTLKQQLPGSLALKIFSGRCENMPGTNVNLEAHNIKISKQITKEKSVHKGVKYASDKINVIYKLHGM